MVTPSDHMNPSQTVQGYVIWFDFQWSLETEFIDHNYFQTIEGSSAKMA